MHALLRVIDDLIESDPDSYKRTGNNVRVTVDRFGRTQRILLARKNNFYVLTSPVAYVESIAGTDAAERRSLLAHIWSRNALKPLVILRIDGRDRVVGQVFVPIDQVSPTTIEFYLKNLARDCDRFEYILTGTDNY
ncbi:MAG: hypothetical protein OXG88_05865 [Gammaproteobacteria bacterium]|nr:hypothetical protein [Gammaproteobacteria bacterium]